MGFSTVAEYLAAQPPATRAVLRQVRAAIRKAIPGAQEVISYQIPAYTLPGGTAIYFAGWKEHFSIYPVGAVAKALKKELAGRVVSKGTIRFRLDERVPVALIAKIAKLRAKETLARAR